MKSLWLLSLSLNAALLLAQGATTGTANVETAPELLTITILDGDDATLNTRQRVSRESIVQVEDENHKPVGGAVLTCAAPKSGASATFSDGNHVAFLTTDERGRAVLRGIRPNQAAGRYSIRVTASKGGASGNSEIHIANVKPAQALTMGLSAKAIVVIAAGAAAAVTAGIVASKGGGPHTNQSTPSVLTLRQGKPIVGAP